jgi:hypothetical protein
MDKRRNLGPLRNHKLADLGFSQVSFVAVSPGPTENTNNRRGVLAVAVAAGNGILGDGGG